MKGNYSLIGIDGNAYSIMAYVRRAMIDTRHTKEEIDAYLKDAMSSDYTHLVQVSNDMIEEINNMGENENE